ncbi:MAG TPA: hypothetical protein VL443_00560 [Cyclobacteriaceae bacterium]|jgi:hypothetical protein|nr:hypothetical protein [Cyclobacteriaceae bacterium]
MKQIALLILSVGVSYCSLGQDTKISYLSITKILSVKFDTAYFGNGQVETVTRCDDFRAIIYPLYKAQKIKTVYQYDNCGNLRNTTTIFEDGDPLHYGILGPRRWTEDNLAKNVTCEVPWKKLFIY